LDLTGYYYRFLQDFSKIASALTNLLKKTTKFEWTEKCERVFQELRQHLTTTSILTLLIEAKEYIVYSDASKNGLGCFYAGVPNKVEIRKYILEEAHNS